jgi:CRISPR-associated protein Cas2
MPDKKWYLITYDIRDSKRLHKVASLMKGYGSRLQYSVFRCRLGEREVEKLRWEMAKLMELEDDLLIIGLCGNCIGRLRNRYGETAWPEEIPGFEII